MPGLSTETSHTHTHTHRGRETERVSETVKLTDGQARTYTWTDRPTEERTDGSTWWVPYSEMTEARIF